jgi:hypothetical protein
MVWGVCRRLLNQHDAEDASVSAGVPNSVVDSTIKAASRFAAGQAVGVISIKVAALTEGVLKTMLLTKLKTVAAMLFVVSVAALAVLLLPVQRSNADIMKHTIHGPKDCPDGLTIKSKATDRGMIQFDVYVDSDAIASNELYKGRARANAVLRITTAQEQIASVVVHGSPEGKGGRRTWYQFSIAPSAAKTSELQLGVSLYEKDGMPTLGGGHSMQIYLAGFEPKREKTDAKPK